MKPIDKLNQIKIALKSGLISYDEAEVVAKKPLAEMNKKMEEVAKRFGKRPTKVSFISFMR